jgi:hypothetical protein
MTVILILHNLVRWLVLLFGFLAVVRALLGYLTNATFTKADNSSSLFFMIMCDVQLLLGLGLYFLNSWYTKLSAMKENMADPVTRFYMMEHGIMMLVAWLLVHIGRIRLEKLPTNRQKHLRGLIYFGIALLLIVIAIPWSFRAGIGRPLFRFH